MTDVAASVRDEARKILGGVKQRQLARKDVQQISAPPTCTSTAEISDDDSMGLRLLASGRVAPPLAPCLAATNTLQHCISTTATSTALIVIVIVIVIGAAAAISDQYLMIDAIDHTLVCDVPGCLLLLASS